MPRQASETGDKHGKAETRALDCSIDDHVGGQIRERRIMLGLTQQQLAAMIGVTYQQAHKYERGINRVSAGRLYEIARALSAPIGYFYEGIGQEGPRQITRTSGCSWKSRATLPRSRTSVIRKQSASWRAPWPVTERLDVPSV